MHDEGFCLARHQGALRWVFRFFSSLDLDKQLEGPAAASIKVLVNRLSVCLI